MNHYAARQRDTDKCWDWTCRNDNQKATWRVGACAGDVPCAHQTKEEAEEHEASRRREKMKAEAPREIDTKKGHECGVFGCQEKSYRRILADHHPMDLCETHLADFSWYKVGEEMSSY